MLVALELNNQSNIKKKEKKEVNLPNSLTIVQSGNPNYSMLPQFPSSQFKKEKCSKFHNNSVHKQLFYIKARQQKHRQHFFKQHTKNT